MEVAVAIIGSGALSALISGLITLISKRMDKNDKVENIEAQCKQNEQDMVRLQLLLLISDYPEETQEIMRVGQRYFDEMHGNWYMTAIFNKWLISNGHAKPEWFKNGD